MPTLTKRRAEVTPDLSADAMLPITVFADLLPHEIVEGRQERKSRRTAIIALVAVVLLVTGWDAYSRWQTGKDQDKLDAANAAAASLVVREHAFTELNQVQAESKRISGQLTTLFASDLEWDKLITAIRNTTPANVTIASIDGSIPQASSKAAGAATAGAVATLALTGTAPTKAAVATMLDTISKITGVTEARPITLTQSNGVYDYDATVSLSKAAFDGKYVPTPVPTPSPKAGK